MSLLFYEEKFASLNPNRSGGEPSPHKMAMLLAVMALIDQGQIKSNCIYFTKELKNQFTQHFNQLKNDRDRDNPHLPFFHLKSSGFWHHQPKPGRKAHYDVLTTASGPGDIERNIAYAYLDDELFELLNNSYVRNYLKEPLLSALPLTNDIRRELLNPGRNSWDWLDCELCVQDYFDMLDKELRGERYNKAEHQRQLLPKLNDRSTAQQKYMNISAILAEIGYPYIQGYKPLPNYQQQLKEVVMAYLAGHQAILDTMRNSDDLTPEVKDINWDAVFDDSKPDWIPEITDKPREFLARKINFTEKEANNRELGLSGELFVTQYERQKLAKLGRDDLMQDVICASKEEGDGLGYDVRSFKVANGQVFDDDPHYIEVKTTTGGNSLPFYMTENEVDFSAREADRYSLYRVYNFSQNPRIFSLPGYIKEHVDLKAKTYLALLKSSQVTS